MIITPVSARTTAGAVTSTVISMPTPVIESCIWDSAPTGDASVTYDIEGRLGPAYPWQKEKTGVTSTVAAPSGDQIVRAFPEMRVNITAFTQTTGDVSFAVACPWGSKLEGDATTG